MSESQNGALDSRRLPFALIVVGILILAGVGFTSGTTGPNIQGPLTASCTVAINGNTCTTSTITFATPYTRNPVISPSFSLNPLTPTHSVSMTLTNIASQEITLLKPTGNATILLKADETPVTRTIPNVDTAIKSFSIGPSAIPPFPSMTIQGEGYVTSTATSLKQVISIITEDCITATLFQTVKVEIFSATPAIIPFSIKAVTPAGSFGFGICAAIDVLAPATDANTMITLNSLRLSAQELNFQTWLNPPAAATSLFNDNNATMNYSFNGQAVLMFISSSIVMVSNQGNPWRLAVQYSTGTLAGPWVNLIFDSLFVPGINVNQTNVTLPNGNFLVRLASVNAGGQGDMFAIGNVNITWTSSTTVSFLVPVGYGTPIIVGETTTSFQLKIQFDATLSAANTVTFTWSSTGI